jgi:hypothetical protein
LIPVGGVPGYEIVSTGAIAKVSTSLPAASTAFRSYEAPSGPAIGVIVTVTSRATARGANVTVARPSALVTLPPAAAVTLIVLGGAVPLAVFVIGFGVCDVELGGVVTGGGVTVNVSVLEAVPVGVVTETTPVIALSGTVAVISVGETIVKVALAPSNVTPLAPVKPVPLIVTNAPADPDIAVNELIAGGGDEDVLVVAVTVNVSELEAVPPGVVTAITPVAALSGTVAVISVAETIVKVALAPSNVTPLAPVKPVPLIVTNVPAEPDVAVNELTVGADDGLIGGVVGAVSCTE